MASLIAHYHELNVYQKAFDLSVCIHKASLNFPKIEQYALADQMRRSSKSVCANIAEGFVKQQTSKPEFKRYLMMALGSATETEVWLEYAKQFGYITDKNFSSWREDCLSIIRMLQKLYNTV